MGKRLNLLHLGGVVLLAIGVGGLLKWHFGTDWWEFAGFVTGVVAVYLAAIEHIINWPIGLANVSIYAWVFFASRLYADMTLQMFFFALSVHGWYQWSRGGEASSRLEITRIRPSQWGWLLLAWASGVAIYYPLVRHFNGAAPFLDSSLTVASIIAQLMLNRKKLENWVLWILIDLIYLPLYLSRDLVATAVLYALFLVLAVLGLNGWRKALAAAPG